METVRTVTVTAAADIIVTAEAPAVMAAIARDATIADAAKAVTAAAAADITALRTARTKKHWYKTTSKREFALAFFSDQYREKT
ncbi:hypothetical protein LJK88_34015 [Paenibacillus sp. P26]|nr:hypothetical protein LJK88_34015 [Paenibacillus sp. P26]